MSELVSILIPAYNAEKWIFKTVKSALDQTWPQKEIIIVDDGSKDNTLQIARGFESKQVKVVSQRNQGACGARNTAYKFAQGEYIQWLDADDILYPTKISTQLYGADCGQQSTILRTSAFGTFYYRHSRAKFKPNSLWKNMKPVEWISTKFNENVWMNPTSWLVSRKLTEMAGPWDERLSIDDDGEYICRVVSKCDGVHFSPESKCYYRVGNLGSLSQTASKSLGPLLLSLSLSIKHLLALEDSPRTREACVNYLKFWYPLFYKGNSGLQKNICDLAIALGGNLATPEWGWKYSLIDKAFGWNFTKKVVYEYRKSKLLLVKNFDRFLYEIKM